MLFAETKRKGEHFLKELNDSVLYDQIFKVLGNHTPLKADCGLLCGGACCKGGEMDGMRLFPHEPTTLPVQELKDGGRLVVCGGQCDRSKRPLACRIFPFFPTIDETGRIDVRPDARALRLCPLLSHYEEIRFDAGFFRALKKVGRLLAKDQACRAFLVETTAEIDTYRAFLE